MVRPNVLTSDIAQDHEEEEQGGADQASSAEDVEQSGEESCSSSEGEEGQEVDSAGAKQVWFAMGAAYILLVTTG